MTTAIGFPSPTRRQSLDPSADGAGGGGVVISPPELPTKWAQIVRGDSPEPTPSANQAPPPEAESESASSSSPSQEDAAAEGNSGNAAAKPMKPAWNKPSNTTLEAVPVMDAASWPDLSEAKRATPKSSPADYSQSDRSTAGSQGRSDLPQKQGNSDAKSYLVNHTTSSAPTTRQKSMKHGTTNSSGSAVPKSMNYSSPEQPMPSQPYYQFPANGYGVVPFPLTSPRELQYRGNNWDSRLPGAFSSQAMSDDRNYSRRSGNFGPRPREDKGYNSGSRRDQEHGSYGNARDFHLQTPRAPPRSFMRPMPPGAAPLMPPHAIRPFANPMPISEFVYFSPLPMVPPPAAVGMPASDPHLEELIRKQIEYYFSDVNLSTDNYLKFNMDEHGWVPLSLISGFNRVKKLTNNILLVLRSLRASNVVEVQLLQKEDYKVRRRDTWTEWVYVQASSDSCSASSSSNGGEILACALQDMTVNGASSSTSGEDDVLSNTDACSEAAIAKGLSGTGQQSSLSNGEVH